MEDVLCLKLNVAIPISQHLFHWLRDGYDARGRLGRGFTSVYEHLCHFSLSSGKKMFCHHVMFQEVNLCIHIIMK